MFDSADRPRPFLSPQDLHGGRSIFCIFSDCCPDLVRDRGACKGCQDFALGIEAGTADEEWPPGGRGGPGLGAA